MLGMTRRELLAAAVVGAAPLGARARWDRTRISAITDEIGNTPEESIAFAHEYGLQFVEIRDRKGPGGAKEYFTLPEAVIKADALRFGREGLKVSFVNTSLMKFTWPGTEPTRRRPEEPAAREKRLAAEKALFDARLDDLHKAIRCAQWMGCDKVRVFTGTRVDNPESAFPRVAKVIGELAGAAAKEKIYLLIENEASQNVATSAELAGIMKLIPSKWVGMNWDPHNAYGKETSFPDGYKLLPRKRLHNVQVKAKGVMPNSPEREDWRAIMTALDRDNYPGKVALETHIFDGTLIAAAHVSMEELMRIVRQVG
jgi:sugar phosphate isomerase/epimerase